MDNENYTYGFEKLDVWKNARELNKKVYLITNTFPPEEKFGLISQIRRASVSISSNIAEGNSRFHTKDQSRFYQIAFGSAVEVLNQLILALDLGFLDIDKLIEIRKLISDILSTP